MAVDNAANGVSSIMLNAQSLVPKENELVRREIQEIGDALEPFSVAVEAGEVTGFSGHSSWLPPQSSGFWHIGTEACRGGLTSI